MNELTIEVSKIISASPEATFDAWLDPEALARFILPKPGMPGPEVSNDPRTGGGFEIIMDVGDKKIPHHGEYVKIERPVRLEFSWNSPFSIEGSMVSILFEKIEEEKTKVTLTHTKFPNQESCDNHRVGWGNILDALEIVLG
ncbi:MAG: SRPBCC domain-containing protein [Gammaproteobacteria bacterium]|nr:SRPBCC domain-containing protein [Gammaproteobacteria bacterium]NKB64100.1 SRPBCC domain-containing protein [Gammaproteobacteria bacterium]